MLKQDILKFQIKKLFYDFVEKKFNVKSDTMFEDYYYQEKQIVNGSHYILNCYFKTYQNSLPSSMVKINRLQIISDPSQKFKGCDVPVLEYSKSVKDALLSGNLL